jgi:DNA-directed RNA polymerase specialized sigma24 family protein
MLMETESQPQISGVPSDVQIAFDRLPTRQREELLLHVNEGLTYKQIAQQKGLTYRIVLRDLARAYGALSRDLYLEGESRARPTVTYQSAIRGVKHPLRNPR